MTNKIFLVIKQDVVEQNTGYIVRAHDMGEAVDLVNDGIYIEETSTTVEDTISSTNVRVVEIDPDGQGQEVNEYRGQEANEG